MKLNLKLPAKLSQLRLPDWLDFKVVVILVLMFLFFLAMAWSEPQPQPHRVSGLAQLDIPMQITPDGASPQTARTGTPIPIEWVTNRKMADGIVLGAVLLVLIIVGGTLSAIRRRV